MSGGNETSRPSRDEMREKVIHLYMQIMPPTINLKYAPAELVEFAEKQWDLYEQR